MTLGRAKSVLSFIWIVAFALLFAIIGVQTFAGKFGKEWDAGFDWFFPLTIPSVSLMITVWTVQQTDEDKKVVTSRHVLWAAMLLSTFYLLAMLGLLLLHPFVDLSLQTQFSRSAWYLAMVQGILMALLGKLFIVNAV